MTKSSQPRQTRPTRGVRRRPDSPYWWISYTGVDGRRVQESSLSTRKADAEAMLLRRKQEVLAGRNPLARRPARLPFAEFAVEYLAWQKDRQRAYGRTANMVDHLTGYFGMTVLSDFTVQMVESWQTHMLAKKYAPASVNRYQAVLKHMFSKAAEYGYVPPEVNQAVHSVRLLRLSNQRLRYLTPGEADKLLAACADHLRPIVQTALLTGMRREEVLGLRWSQVDMDNRLIMLDVTKSGERREIPVSASLLTLLTMQAKHARGPWVFHDHGRRYGSVKKSFATAVSDAGLSDFRFHDLRHTFASNLVMAGVDLRTVQDLLGHKSLAMTMRYAHLADSHRADAVDRLDRAMGRGKADAGEASEPDNV